MIARIKRVAAGIGPLAWGGLLLLFSVVLSKGWGRIGETRRARGGVAYDRSQARSIDDWR
jgi:hypothetical protein